MRREREVVLQRQEDGWYATVRGELVALELSHHAFVVEAVDLVRARYEYDRLGIRAADIGPAATLVALSAGHGGTIWLRR